MTAVVVVGAPLPRKKQERARAVCLEVLVVYLAELGVSRVVLEERTPSLNDLDLYLVDAIRGKKLIPTEMRIDVERPSTEAMLWLPDIVAGAVGAERARGNPTYLDPIRSQVTQHDVPMR